MEKPWRVSDSCTNNEEDFATEAEALAFADELLKGHREEAAQEGEWCEEVEFLRVYRLVKSARVSMRGNDSDGLPWVDYAVMSIS